MTLTELKYVVALAQERHFGRAAQKCFVTQPTLSLALAKLEEELGLKLFERNKSEVIVTPRGGQVVEQARKVLDEVGKIQHIAKGSHDQLAGALRLGVIPTIGPYLLPDLIPILKKRAPAMTLSIEENLTGNLAPMLREGELDVVVIALPFSLPGVKTQVVYEEPFSVVVPEGHRWGTRKAVKPSELDEENLLVLNNGHCFRDQVLEACPGQPNTAQPEGRAGSSLETIRNMVASGLGVSVLPASALVSRYSSRLVRVVPFASPIPSRKVALAWRTSFDRPLAVEALAESIRSVKLPSIKIAK
ncbi:hydrogen peroxide-inducible genes activator [Usitatibacter palustris]|uniref:Hydrogen peroxide sensor n=1 Tax=Usitatibacter palustris TaxID=2732487 RepID=A0A6M4H7R4_9PROT|nr:hydrogen peroxide-inducible genes activator [Usitatibacter palustris]QJR14733.1 Hydrogen peroxide sensor [Usitatibacter palustris]